MNTTTSLLLAQGLQIQLDLLRLNLACGGPPVPPSTAPWKNYSLADYDSLDDYCISCLIDDNLPTGSKCSSLCWLPVVEPGGTVNLDGLQAAQKAILDPENHVVPNDPKTLQGWAKKLVALMEYYSVKPDKKLMKLAKECQEDRN